MGRKYDFYVQMTRTISHLFAARTREILSLLLECRIHTLELTSDFFLFIISNIINTHGRDLKVGFNANTGYFN